MKVLHNTLPLQTLNTAIKSNPQLTQITAGDQVHFSGNLANLTEQVLERGISKPLNGIMTVIAGVANGAIESFGAALSRTIVGFAVTGAEMYMDVGKAIKSNNNKIGDLLKELGYNKTAKALTEADMLAPVKKLLDKLA